MPRSWDGSAGFDQIVICSAGGLAAIDGGPITVCAIWRPAQTWAGDIIQARAGSTPVWGLLTDTDGKYYIVDDFSGFASYEVGQWQLICYTKASGSAAVRWHLYRYDTATWTHTGGSTINDPGGTVTEVRLGQGYGRLDGDVEAVGVWNSVLTDAQVEELAYSLQAWYALNPSAAWLMDQAATTQPIRDCTGNGASESSITGTSPTISTYSVPLFSLGHSIEVVGQTAGTTHDATASLSTTASLTATAWVDRPATSTMTTTASLSTTAAVDRPATSALSTTTALTATGAITLSDATSAMSSAATLTNSASVDAIGTSALTTSAALTSAGETIAQGTAALSTTASLTAAGAADRPATAALSTAAALTAVGEVIASATVALTTTASLTASAGATVHDATAAVGSAAALSIAAAVERMGTASLGAVATMTTNAETIAAGLATLATTASLTAVASVVRNATVTLSAVGSLTAVAASGIITRPDTGRIIRPYTGIISRP